MVHVSRRETSFVLLNYTHTHICTHIEPIQQPSLHLVCPFGPLWHCLWKHVHLVLPCLPPLAVVPITHILSPLQSRFLPPFFPPSPSTYTLQGILAPLSLYELHPLSFLHSEQRYDSSLLTPVLPPPLWMKLYMSDKNNNINQTSVLPFIFTWSPVPLDFWAAVSLILSLFHVLPFFIWLPTEVISRVYGGGGEGLSCPSAVGLGWAARGKVIKPPAPTVCCWWILEWSPAPAYPASQENLTFPP